MFQCLPVFCTPPRMLYNPFRLILGLCRLLLANACKHCKKDKNTKTKKENKDVTLSKRSPEKFFVDYNVGNEAFEYRILVDQAPQTEWRKMDVGARPFIKSFKKTFEF